jgi:hypothetical protein
MFMQLTSRVSLRLLYVKVKGTHCDKAKGTHPQINKKESRGVLGPLLISVLIGPGGGGVLIFGLSVFSSGDSQQNECFPNQTHG